MDTEEAWALLSNDVFHDRLGRVREDIQSEWPKLRDDKELNLFSALKTALVDLPDIHETIELLNIYAICLDYLHRYPLKKEKAHCASLKRVLKTDVYEIVQRLWGDQFLTIYPFDDPPLSDELILGTSKYLFALFNLDDDSFGLDDFAELWLLDLCLDPDIIITAVHCFFFADTNEVRRHAYKTLQAVLEFDQAGFGFEQYFKEELGPTLAMRQFQMLMDSRNIADDCVLHVLQDVDTIVSVNTSLPTLWEQVVSKSFSILDQQCAQSSNRMEYHEIMLALKVPNIVLKGYFSCPWSPSPLSILETMIVRYSGMRMMASAIILYAKTADYFAKKPPPKNVNPQQVYKDNCRILLDYCLEKMFLIPVLLTEMSKIKHWKFTEHNFISFLAEKGKGIWKDTLDELRRLGSNDQDMLPEFHRLDAALFGWHSLGSLIGLHQLVESLVGCYYARCKEFLKESSKSFGRCSGCKQAQYCSPICQKNDWKMHRHHCPSKAMEE